MTKRRKLLLSAFVARPASRFLEWVAYHRAIGATGILIFTDRRQAGKHPLFEALAEAGAVSLTPIPVDPDMKEEIHNSSIRAAQAELGESGGYGLYLASDEYFCIHSGAKSLQSLMQASGGADVLSAPVRVAGMDGQRKHQPGPILHEARPVAPVTGNTGLRSVVRLGLFASRTPEIPTARLSGGKAAVKWMNGNGAPMPEPHSRVTWAADGSAHGADKASILKIPAPSAETFLLAQEALPVKQRPAAEALIDRLKVFGAVEGEALEVKAWQGAIAKEIDALMALPGVAEAQEAICAEEIAALDKLRASSEDFQRIVAVCRGERAPSAVRTPAPVQEEPVPTPVADPDLPIAGETALPPWFAEIHTGGEQEGFYTRLRNHAVLLIRRDPGRLVVTFDNLSSVNDLSPEREPWAYKFLRDNGCSHLSIMARRKDWYRDPQLIAYLEKLAADGLFAEFEKVILTGTSMGGFAALAFASLAPGATVVSFSPQTTLDESLVPWEKRFRMGRARNWSLPHSDCAFEIDEVEKAFVLYDPFFEPDRRHVERLEGDNVVPLKTWCSGHFSPVFLRRADLLKPLLQHVLDDTLTPQVFYRMFRGRRFLPWYRKALLSNLQERGHDELARIVTPAFRKLKRQAAE